jgi:hypothetical protein
MEMEKANKGLINHAKEKGNYKKVIKWQFLQETRIFATIFLLLCNQMLKPKNL